MATPMINIKTLSDNEWIIHGKVYDLTKWLSSHPGGPTILNMNRRQDCTELFETYHILSSRDIHSMMKSYFVRNATKDEIQTPYDWDDTKYKDMKLDLKKRTRKYFTSSSLSSKATNTYKAFYSSLFLLSIINSYFYYNGYWISTILFALFGWYFSGDILHCGLHYAVFSNYFYNELVSYLFGLYHCSFTVWFIQHTVSHHAYTNMLDLDADLCWHDMIWWDQQDDGTKVVKNHFGLRVLIFFKRDPPKTKIQLVKYKHDTKTAFLCKMAVFSSLTSLFPILSLFDVFRWDISKWVQLKWKFNVLSMIITYVQTFIVLLFIPFVLMNKMGFIKGFLFFLIPRLLHGYIYHTFSQINHINKFSFQNNELQQTKNFIVHQIMSSCDYGVESMFVSVIALGLNNQVLHHLFPSVHHCHYPGLSKILKEFCKEYGIKQSVHDSTRDAIYDYMQYLFSINMN